MFPLANDINEPVCTSSAPQHLTEEEQVLLLGQSLQHGLQFLTYELDQSILYVTVRDIDHEDKGRWVGRLILLQEGKTAYK